MNAVQPIRDKNTIEDIKSYLKYKSERDYTLFCTGIYIPLRISDILKLRVRDVRNKESIKLRETKTGKNFELPINITLRKIFYDYCKNKKDYEFLFPSPIKRNGQLSRQQAYNILNDAADQFGLELIGCHTMRKTFGYHFYQQNKDNPLCLEMLRKIFNHHSIEVTLRYIGLEDDLIFNIVKSFAY